MDAAIVGNIISAAAAVGAIFYSYTSNKIAKQSLIDSAKNNEQLLSLTRAQNKATEEQTLLARKQNEITDDQAKLEKSVAEAEKLPNLKFVITAGMDENQHINGYDLIVINHGKSPAAISVPRYNSANPDTMAKNVWQIYPRLRPAESVEEENVEEDEDLISHFLKNENKTRIGHFEPMFCNTVIVDSQTHVRFYVGNSQLVHAIEYMKKTRMNLGFLLYESIEKREYILQLKFKEKEGVTIESTSKLCG